MTEPRRSDPDWPATPRRVVVTGMGMLTALGNDVPTTWEALLSGRSAVMRLGELEKEGCLCQIGAPFASRKPQPSSSISRCVQFQALQ